MDWDKAKNLIIIFLLIINAFLLALVYRSNTDYQVKPAQERAIRDLLSQNRISTYSEILRDYAPMKELAMSAYKYNMPVLLNVFFGNDKTSVTYEYNKTIYKTDEARLTLQNGYLSYDNPYGTGAIELKREAAAATCSEFIKNMGSEFNGFRLDREIPSDYGFTLEYREVYKNNTIYSNFIEFFVTADGIVRIDLMYNKPDNYPDQPAREICPADEALFAFLQRVSGLNSGREIFINKMDMVYLQEETGSSENISYKATPYYRIYINEMDTPFLINAYLNIVL